MYNRNTNNDKNEIAQKTAEFIDERIGIISKELGSTEADLETFKRDAGITDLSSDAQIALTGNAEYEKKQVENRTQISLVEDLKKYLGHNEYEILPSNVGLKDITLAAQIDRYNEMLIERKRLLRTSTENNRLSSTWIPVFVPRKRMFRLPLKESCKDCLSLKLILIGKPNVICVVSVMLRGRSGSM